ncbi:hypothetical protein EUX98_g1884 [Antrodiella citrinella]|uniref:Uncharacterized protein n=1 Tax=Antrodiella citrinella TaxID=2447956 RepID=A0A4S4N090_9APHY|nr:hypothetical protein EUX98_g1884 [Antrodiella citrinella]
MPPARHSLEGNPGSGLDDPFPREWINYRYRINSVTPRTLHSYHQSHPSRSLPVDIVRRDSAQAIPHPPPPYTPTVALHAATLAPNVPDPSLDPANPNWQSVQSTPPPPVSPVSHATSPGVVVAAVLISTILALVAVVITIVIMKKKRIRLRIPIPTFLQRNSVKHKMKNTKHWKVLKLTPNSTECNLIEKERNSDLLRRTTSLFQYVHVTLDDDNDTSPLTKATGAQVSDPVSNGDASACLSPVRRHSSPSLPSESLPSSTLGPIQAAQRPMSLPPLDREAALLIQQQRMAEVAQIHRMKTLGSDSPLVASDEEPRRSPKGLGIVEHDDKEEDIGSTVLAALQHYKLSLGKSLPDVPASDIFHVNEGDIVRTSMALPTSSVSDPESFDSMGNSTLSGDSDIDVEIGVAKTHSVEIQKGILVSLTPDIMDVPQLMISTPSTIASRRVNSSPQLTYTTSPSQDYLRPYSPTMGLDTLSSSDALNTAVEHFHGTPPPMLSPILTSSVTLSAEIQDSMEERVFAYRTSGLWAKESYKLTLPGQVRALGDALGFRRSHTYQAGMQWPTGPVIRTEEV